MVNGEKGLNILRRKQVEAMTGLSRSSLYAKVKDGAFPVQVKLGIRCVGWLEHEIQDWLNERIAASRGGVSYV